MYNIIRKHTILQHDNIKKKHTKNLIITSEKKLTEKQISYQINYISTRKWIAI